MASWWLFCVCTTLLVWFSKSDEDLYTDSRMKRQAEFPTVTEGPHISPTNTSFWRRIWKKITESTDGTSRSWASDIFEGLFKLVFSMLGSSQGKAMEGIPTNPDAEFIPGRFRAAQVISDDI